MKGSIRSKLPLSLIILAIMTVLSAIPFLGSLNHIQAANSSRPTPLPSGIITPSSTPPKPTPTFEPAHWTIQKSITYAKLSFGTYMLNLYTPKPPPTKPAPLVLFFHGCCNPNTNRNNALRLGQRPADSHEYMFRAMMNNGYKVAVLDYPAEYPVVNKHDAEAGKAAVRFFRANAATYHIDPKRIIAWGSSGGGNPVSIMGTADKSAHLDFGQYLNYSSRVEAVLDWYGLANLQYITSDDAPFLIQQGEEDFAFIKTYSKQLYRALTAAHVFVELQWVAHATHRLAPSGGTTNPDYQEIAQWAITFLNEKVRDNPNPLPQ